MPRAPKKTADPAVPAAPRSPARTKAAKAKVPVVPTEEQIRMRAFDIFLRRNGAHGDAYSDWLQAERELREELNR